MFITELNLKYILNGFFGVENVGIQFQKIANIPMGEQENQE